MRKTEFQVENGGVLGRGFKRRIQRGVTRQQIKYLAFSTGKSVLVYMLLLVW